MSVAKVASYPDDWERRGISHILRRRSREQFEAEGRHQAAVLQPLIPTGATVLDFGCGVGRVAKHVTADRVIGVDVNRRFLTEASRHIETWPTDGLTIPLPDNTVDFAYSLMVLQHCYRGDHPTILAELARVLRPGAYAYVQFPDADSGYYRPGPFVNVYTADEVAGYIPDGCTGIVTAGRLAGYADGNLTVDREHILMFTKAPA